MSATGPAQPRPGGLAILRFGFGLALLVAPDRVLLAAGGEDDERARVVARILGVRHLIEAAVLVRYETAPVALAGAAVDGTHAATALAFAAVDRERRRIALINAAMAAFLTVAGVLHARSLPPR